MHATNISDETALVWQRVYGLFVESADAQAWMTTPSKYLCGVTPESLLATAKGRKLVLDELGRIEYGTVA